MSIVLESAVEKYLKTKVKALGGECLKWVCPGNSGVPDRIVIYKGIFCLVETKAKRGRLSPIQSYMRKRLSKNTDQYYIVHTREKADEFIKTLKAISDRG